MTGKGGEPDFMASDTNGETQRDGQSLPRDQACYEIKIKGHLDSHWSEWFDGLALTYAERGETILSGPVRDQAALHGLLIKIRDLGLPLLSVNRVERPGD